MPQSISYLIETSAICRVVLRFITSAADIYRVAMTLGAASTSHAGSVQRTLFASQ